MKSHRTKVKNDQIVIQMIKDYRDEVGQRTGGIKLHDNLKAKMEQLGIKMMS